MTKEEKCIFVKEKGYIYNKEDGKIIGVKGKQVLSENDQGYVIINFKKNNKGYSLRGHIFAWFYEYGEVVNCIDHINGVRNDNKILNLRSVTQQENTFNNLKSKGYHFCKTSKKWRAQIMIDYKKVNLGRYDTQEEARNKYLEAKKLYHKIK